MKRKDLSLVDTLMVCRDLREDEWDQITKMGGARDDDSLAAWAHNVNGPKWAYTDDTGKTLLVGGFIPFRAGVYGSWFLATDYAWKNHARELTLEAIERKEYMFAGGAHRIETVCLASREAAHVWYKKVGSLFESTLKGYCVDGSDAMMFADTRGPMRKH